MIYVFSNKIRHSFTKTFTTLHSTSLHLSTLHFFPFKLHPTTLHYPLIWLNPISISRHSVSPHINTLHFIRSGDMAPAICGQCLYVD